MRGTLVEIAVKLEVRSLHADRGLAVTPAVGVTLGMGWCVTHISSGKKVHSNTYSQKAEAAIALMGRLLETGVDWTQEAEAVQREFDALPADLRRDLLQTTEPDGRIWVRW